MSSVGSSSDSSNSSASSNETVRKTREEARAAESDMVKKHQKEIRRLNEEHYAEVEGIKNNFAQQIEDVKQHSSNQIDERDHRYQQEIDGVRGLYQKRLQEQADENQRQTQALHKSQGNDNTQERIKNEQHVQALTEDYNKNLRRQEKNFSENIEQSRDQQQKAVAENREKLTRKYDQDEQGLIADRNQRVGELQHGLDDTRRTTNQQLRDQDVRHLNDKQRASEAMISALRRQELTNRDQEKMLRDGFKDGLDRTRDRFEKAASDRREVETAGLREIQGSSGERMQNQVLGLQQQKEDLKADNIRDNLRQANAHKREIADVTDAYQKNLEVYREQRDMGMRDVNDKAHKELEKVNREKDQQIVETNRFYRGEEDEQDRIHRSAYDSLKGNFEIREQQQKTLADRRIKNVSESSADERARMAQLQGESHTSNQHSHQDQMKALRSNMEDDKRIAVTNLQDRLQKQELQHSERIAAVVSKYEKQIQTLKDQLEKEKRTNDTNFRRSVEDLQRQHKTSLDQLEAQNRDRLRQMDAIHAEELRQTNKRNDEKIDQVMADIKKA